MLTKHIKNHVKQIPKGCGQACVAMILGCNLKKADGLLGITTSAGTDEVMQVLEDNGYPNLYITITDGITLLPDFGIIIIKNNRNKYHVFIKDENILIDPNISQVYDLNFYHITNEIIAFIKLKRMN